MWNERALARRGGQALDRRPRWLRAVVRDVLAAYHRAPADRPRALAAFLGLTIGELEWFADTRGLERTTPAEALRNYSYGAVGRRARPARVIERPKSRLKAVQRLATPHLPQGAPTSPALANLQAFGLDRRLSGLAASIDATDTRYADDIAFSGADSCSRARTAFARRSRPSRGRRASR